MQEVDANQVIQKLLEQNQQLTMQVAVLQVQLEQMAEAAPAEEALDSSIGQG